MSDVVFVLGACLDPMVVRAYAAKLDVDPTSVRPIGRAYLPDHEPCFVSTRRGAALSARPRRGAATAGALFECRDGLRIFDAAHADHAHSAHRRLARVLTDDGAMHTVQCYELAPPDPVRALPDAEALDPCLRGLLRFGHDVSPVRAAASGRRPTTEPSSVFVYGTLRRGESGEAYIQKHDPFEGGKGVVHGSVGGRLYDLGAYPGLVPHADRTVRVQGEVYTFADLDAVFADLDAVEGFAGYDEPVDEYVRAIVRVDLDGRERVAWTYVYAGSTAHRSVIAGGDWTARQPSDAAHSAGA